MAHPKLGLIWFMNQHWNLLWSTLDNNPNPSRFSHIYIYSKGPSTPFYTISPSSNIILVVLSDNYFDFGFLIHHAWFSTGFYMSSLQELCANWVISDAPGRRALGSPRTYHARIPWQNTTSHPNVTQRYKADINDKVFPRKPYTMECHTCNAGYTMHKCYGETYTIQFRTYIFRSLDIV